MVSLHFCRAKYDLFMQKLYTIKLGVNALMKTGLEALMRLDMKARSLYLIKASAWR